MSPAQAQSQAQAPSTPTKTLEILFVDSKDERKRFIEFPYQHYKGDSFWVPPLRMDQKKLIDTKRNPFFENAEIACFVASRDGQPAGRIAAIVDRRYNEFHKTNTGFFGFFECVDDEAVADLLFRAAEGWLSDKGVSEILGPASPGMMDEIGILIEGFDEHPTIMMPYSKPYYNDLLKRIGLEKAMDLLTFHVDVDTVQDERSNRAIEIIKARTPGLSIRKINLRKLNAEIRIIRHIFNSAWSRNWGFIPLSENEFKELAKTLKMAIDPEVAFIAELDGEPVGFSISLPDFNQIFRSMNGRLFPTGIFKLLLGRRKISQVRTALMGVLPEYRGKGVDALLHQKLIENGPANGYLAGEMGWVLENNLDMIRVAEKLGARRSKVYRMYRRSLA